MYNDLECAPDAATPDALKNISVQDTNQSYPIFLTIDKTVEYTGLSRTTIEKILNAYSTEAKPYIVPPDNSRKFIIRDEIIDYIVSKYRGENDEHVKR